MCKMVAILFLAYICEHKSISTSNNDVVISCHYSDIIMGAMASQITSLTIVYSTICSVRRSTKASKLRVTGLCAGNSPVTGEFPTQMVSDAENVSIWRCNHVLLNNQCILTDKPSWWVGTKDSISVMLSQINWRAKRNCRIKQWLLRELQMGFTWIVIHSPVANIWVIYIECIEN